MRLRRVRAGGAVPQGAHGHMGVAAVARGALGDVPQRTGPCQRLVLRVGGLDGVDVRGTRPAGAGGFDAARVAGPGRGALSVQPAQQGVQGGLAGAHPLRAGVVAGQPGVGVVAALAMR
ncbi:hypothetical protein GCM10023238_14710 [Streptomyces heliomycini]